MRTFFPRMQARELLVTLVLLACYFRVTVQQRDPINNFCRRWGHQTAVVDDKLYIDGGLITYSGSSSPENVTSTSARVLIRISNTELDPADQEQREMK